MNFRTYCMISCVVLIRSLALISSSAFSAIRFALFVAGAGSFPTSSTSNTSVAPGGMVPGAPLSP